MLLLKESKVIEVNVIWNLRKSHATLVWAPYRRHAGVWRLGEYDNAVHRTLSIN